MDRELWIVVGLTAIALLLVGAAYYAYSPNNPDVITTLKEKNVPFNKLTGIASTCGRFSSLDLAKKRFSFPGEWVRCKNEANRWIIFYESNNTYAFLTCKKLNNAYYCCVMASRKPTYDFNTWKSRCT